jgi:agmatinase
MTMGVDDLGDLELGTAVETGWRDVADRLASAAPASFLTVLGGDHCTAVATLAAEKRRHPELAVVWIDAHPDLNDVSRGGRWTCGCALRRAVECAGMEPADVAFAGLRDFDWEEVEFTREKGMLSLTCAQVARDPLAAGRELARWSDGRPVHVSFDIDVLDPAFAPGTEIPSAGGLSTRDALNLLTGLAAGSRLVGLDVTEVSPPLDPTDITVIAALKIIFELWGLAVGNG